MIRSYNYLKKFSLAVIFLLSLVIILTALSCGSTYINIFTYFSLEPLMKEIVIMRLMRVIIAFTVGGALSVAGAGYQAILRNVLAEPFILGISGGASIGVAFAIIMGISFLGFFTLPLFAFLGALIVLSLVLLMSKGDGIEYSSNIILSGVILSTITSSILMFIISYLNMTQLNSITWWLLGNLEPENWSLVIVSVVIVFAGTFTLFLYGREINACSMGEEVGYYLGISPVKLAVLVLGISSLMTACVVSISGIIGFVGLIIPHIVRKFVGSDHRKLIPFALVYGGLYLVFCDTIARTVVHPQILPVGVVTALIGGPVFLWILNRRLKS